MIAAQKSIPNDAPRTWYLLPKPQDMNDATELYVKTIARAGECLGFSLNRVYSVRELPSRANVVTLDCRTAFNIRMLRPRCRVWLWLQGAVPEECDLHFGKTVRNKLRIACYRIFERTTIPRAQGTFMVSQAMREHYLAKYGYSGSSFVMPCVNQDLSDEAFSTPSKYTDPTFVYAGSMHRWQCFELSLEVFRRVRLQHPNAQLTVLTGDQATAQAAVEKAGLTGVEITRVPLEQLQDTLRAFKYGFVLREPHVVNQVATPTKVSSYMAAGVIPIMTTAVGDYTLRLGSMKNVVMNSDMDAAAIAAKVLEFEARSVSSSDVLTEYQQVFSDYFDHNKYVPEMANFLRSTGLN
ncbi:MAG: glycosyltransferase [Planctomycetes bacterium]|nr:glycosyltransferase [Planctomycetota bacterium]